MPQPIPQYGEPQTGPYRPEQEFAPPQPPRYGSAPPHSPAYLQQAGYPAAGQTEQGGTTPPYGPGYAAQGYSQAAPYASPPKWAPPTPYPQGYQGAYGEGPAEELYRSGPAGYPYPEAPRRRRRHGPRTLLILLSITVLIAAVLPILSTMATSGYANSSYVAPQPDPNPPALPKVANGSTAQNMVAASALYGQSVPNPTKCTVTSIDLTAASESELQSHMSDVVACLMRVWDVTVTRAGYTMPRPPVVVYSAALSTGCGKLATLNAAYCGSDQKIYYATDLPQAIPKQLRSSRFIVEVIVAHEFGHAVQARTGILTAAHGLADTAPSQGESHEWSRRTELQADCFAGLFIRSVSRSTGITQQDLDNIASLMVAFGDDSMSTTTEIDGGHGLGATRKYWMQLGLASTSTTVCNTFTAASDEVR